MRDLYGDEILETIIASELMLVRRAVREVLPRLLL